MTKPTAKLAHSAKAFSLAQQTSKWRTNKSTDIKNYPSLLKLQRRHLLLKQ